MLQQFKQPSKHYHGPRAIPIHHFCTVHYNLLNDPASPTSSSVSISASCRGRLEVLHSDLAILCLSKRICRHLLRRHNFSRCIQPIKSGSKRRRHIDRDSRSGELNWIARLLLCFAWAALGSPQKIVREKRPCYCDDRDQPRGFSVTVQR